MWKTRTGATRVTTTRLDRTVHCTATGVSTVGHITALQVLTDRVRGIPAQANAAKVMPVSYVVW